MRKVEIGSHLFSTVLTTLSFALGSTFALADPVDKYVQGQMKQKQIPGVALAVVRAGARIKTAAYGLANIELNVRVKPETVFEIGSITKQFTSAGILLLAQDGKLSVDDPITRHLNHSPPAWTNITLRHLLTHTSGIKNYTGLDGFELLGI
jgi:CubicO group peptidase (beta-lactamase class C family)